MKLSNYPFIYIHFTNPNFVSFSYCYPSFPTSLPPLSSLLPCNSYSTSQISQLNLIAADTSSCSAIPDRNATPPPQCNIDVTPPPSASLPIACHIPCRLIALEAIHINLFHTTLPKNKEENQIEKTGKVRNTFFCVYLFCFVFLSPTSYSLYDPSVI